MIPGLPSSVKETLMLRRLIRHTVWEPGALDHEPKKFRSLWRVWLPLYDTIAAAAGIFALFYGSRLLDRIFGPMLVDYLGASFAIVAMVCFVGVSYPALWRVETVGKCLLIGMVIAYVWCILFLPSPQQITQHEAPNFFIACMLLVGLPLPLFRLNQLAEERFERRVQAQIKEWLS